MSRPPSLIAVVIPAHDEADRVAAALAAVETARRQLPAGVGCRVVVVADACTDGTDTVARRAMTRPGDLVLTVAHRNVGAARRAGVDRVLASSCLPHRRVWIANTDADTVVGPRWLRTQAEAASRGVLGLVGVVDLLDDAECDSGLRQAFGRYYQVHPDGSHGHVHGANFGVRADAYLAAGGWRPLITGEDQDLWHRLHQRGFGDRLVAQSSLDVRTSARRQGRAPAGFAADLMALDRSPV